MLPILALLATAQAADLTLQFQGEGTTPATAHQVAAEAPPLLALTDDQGDDWLVLIDSLVEAEGAVSIAGAARLVDVPDLDLERRFALRVAYDTPAPVVLTDPDGLPRTLLLTVAPSRAEPVVDCGIMVAPTVGELAEALQEFVDEGRQPRTGTGVFTVEEGAVEAQWVCGW